MAVIAVASLNYTTPTGEGAPRIIGTGPRMSESYEGFVDDPHEVDLHDGRCDRDDVSMDERGFRLIEHASAVANLLDDRMIRAHYLREAEAIALYASGADKAIAFDWTRRTAQPATPTNLAVGAPVLRVHNDFTVRSANETMRAVLSHDGSAPPKERFAIVTVWRSIVPPPHLHPLALADARSFPAVDLFPVRRSYPTWDGEMAFARWRPTHRWVTFPAMQTNEVLIFKVFDSAESVARWSPHAAFEDHHSRRSVQPRASIEVRVLACY